MLAFYVSLSSLRYRASLTTAKESIVSDISDHIAVRRVRSVKVDLEVRMIGNDTNGFNMMIPVS